MQLSSASRTHPLSRVGMAMTMRPRQAGAEPAQSKWCKVLWSAPVVLLLIVLHLVQQQQGGGLVPRYMPGKAKPYTDRFT